MEQHVRVIAVYLAVLVFFIMAVAGWLFGCSPVLCGGRALAGAVIMYSVIQISGRIVIKILLNAMVESHLRRQADRIKQ